MNILFSFLLATIVATSAPAQTEQSAALPEEFTLDIDFSKSWPFTVNWYKPFEQNLAKGDTYTYVYKYEVDGREESAEFDFLIYGNKTNYKYLKGTGDGVMFLQPDPKSATTRITLPAVPGRYLKSVTLEITNKYPKRFEIVDSKTWKAIVVSEGSTNAAPATVNFSAEGVSTQANKPYFLRLIDVNTLVTGIILVYSSSL